MKIFNKGNYKVLLPVIILALLLFAVFVFAVPSVNFLISRNTPTNGTAVATTAYVFNCTFNTNTTGNITNATLYLSSKGDGAPTINQTTNYTILGNITNNTLVNFTVTGIAEGTYLWACGASNESGSKFVNSTSLNNWSITFDTTPPVVTGISPNSISIPTNYTALPIKFNVTIREANNLSSVFYILNTVVAAGGANPGLNDSSTVNSSHFMTLAAGSQDGSNYTYTANLTLNFSSPFTTPGAHSLWFCANDTANNVRCSDTSLSYVIKGVNISELKSVFNGVGLYAFSMNITLENFTADEDLFMAPTLQNYTMTFNLTADRFVNIVGMTINESYMRDVGNTEVNKSITSGVRTAIGNDFDINITFMNVSSFLPEGTLYKYGRFDFISKQFERLYHCTGSIDSPICTQISSCNGTVVLNGTYDNSTRIIPENSACFVTNLTSYNGINSGNTYIYSGTFSGGAGANDSIAPTITFVNPTQNQNVTSLPFNINISFIDSGAGIANNSINITINGTMYSNRQNTSLLSCTPNTNASTTITCNVTLNTLKAGLKNITVSVSDTSGNSNISSVTFNLSIAPDVTLNHPRDQSWFQNTTNAIVFNYTVADNDLIGCSLWGNFTNSSFAMNETNKSAVVGGYPGTMTNFSGLKFVQGSYVWNVRCNDTYGYTSQRSANYTFYVDTTAPAVTTTVSKSSPSVGETVTISCSVTDNMDSNPTVTLSSIDTPNGASLDLDGTFTDTSTAGAYKAYCRGVDVAGSVTYSYTAFTVYGSGSGGSSGSSGSGGSSGGAVSTTSTLFTKVLANEPVEAKISNAETGVDSVSLTANEELNNVKISVGQFSENPVTKVIEGAVFKYLEIKATNAPDDKLSRIFIKFHVDKAWLTDNNAEAGDVLFSRYVDGAWAPLGLTKVSEDSEKVYYTSVMPGLSYFAISLKSEVTNSEQPTTEEVTETPEVIPPEEVITKEVPKSSKTWLWVVLGLLLVGGVSIGLYLMQRNKPRFGKK